MWRHGEGGQINYVTVPIMPGGLLPEPGNLKAVSIDLGVATGQKAEPGTKYRFRVVFQNDSDQAFAGVPVAVLHVNTKPFCTTKPVRFCPKRS